MGVETKKGGRGGAAAAARKLLSENQEAFYGVGS